MQAGPAFLSSAALKVFPTPGHKAITVTMSIWTVSVHQLNRRLDFKSPNLHWRVYRCYYYFKKQTKVVQLPCPVSFVTRNNAIPNQGTPVIQLQGSQIRSPAYQNFPPSAQWLWEQADWHHKLDNIISFKQLIVSLLKATWVCLTYIDSSTLHRAYNLLPLALTAQVWLGYP